MLTNEMNNCYHNEMHSLDNFFSILWEQFSTLALNLIFSSAAVFVTEEINNKLTETAVQPSWLGKIQISVLFNNKSMFGFPSYSYWIAKIALLYSHWFLNLDIWFCQGVTRRCMDVR